MGQWVKWFWGLTRDFWAENAEKKTMVRDKGNTISRFAGRVVDGWPRGAGEARSASKQAHVLCVVVVAGDEGDSRSLRGGQLEKQRQKQKQNAGVLRCAPEWQAKVGKGKG